MATIGRKPVKQARPGSASSTFDAAQAERSAAFKRLMEEEAQREKFAEVFAEQGEKERREELARKEAQERQRREQEELIKARKNKPNPIVFLDVEVRGPSGKVDASGRLEIELFADQVPLTAENFRCLCTGERGKHLHFTKSIFHRIVPGFMAQGGDITRGDGSGGISIYGPTFADESVVRLHARCNLLSMANSGPDSNNSQFFVLFKQCKHLDRKHVVFGEIVREDGNVMKRMEARGSESGSVDGSVVVVSCGELGGAEDEQKSRERFRRSRSRTDSASRRRKQRKCYI